MILDDCYISYLNLDHRLDRLMLLATALERMGVKAERTRGKMPDEYDLSEPRYAVMRARTPGAIGCYEGQLTILRTAMENGKHAFVMEDDIEFCSDFMERMEYITEFTENNEWDIIWLGATFHIGPAWWHTGFNRDLPGFSQTGGRDAELTHDKRMIRTYGSFCTYAYIVNVNSLKKVISLLFGYMGMSMGIDWTMIKISPQLNTFAFVPGCIKQRDNMSDIGKGMTVFSGFAKLGPYWYADKMTDFDPSTFDWKEAKIK